MSKITIITASPRKDGNSLQMARWFAEEAEHLGAEDGYLGHSALADIIK